MTAELLKERLRKHLKRDLELVINENRSTMVSLQRDRKRLSLHKMFLDAPEPVIEAIAHYVRGIRKEASEKNRVLRGYIQENLPRFDISDRIDRSKLEQKGRVYNLQPFYEQINSRYFDGKLDLGITWYADWGRRVHKSRIVFGQYHDNLRLVKIHRILDDPFFPEFFVRFILYHEMLHAALPGYVDAYGRFSVHGPEFKAREREFEEYKAAVVWEKANKKEFFRG